MSSKAESAAWMAVLLFAIGCAEPPTAIVEDDACDEERTFACSRTADGERTGALLLCENGAYTLARACRDREGCFTEASSTIGRCFHGDGTGEQCSANDGLSCCTFQEPDIVCQ